MNLNDINNKILERAQIGITETSFAHLEGNQIDAIVDAGYVVWSQRGRLFVSWEAPARKTHGGIVPSRLAKYRAEHAELMYA